MQNISSGLVTTIKGNRYIDLSKNMVYSVSEWNSSGSPYISFCRYNMLTDESKDDSWYTYYPVFGSSKSGYEVPTIAGGQMSNLPVLNGCIYIPIVKYESSRVLLSFLLWDISNSTDFSFRCLDNSITLLNESANFSIVSSYMKDGKLIFYFVSPYLTKVIVDSSGNISIEFQQRLMSWSSIYPDRSIGAYEYNGNIYVPNNSSDYLYILNIKTGKQFFLRESGISSVSKSFISTAHMYCNQNKMIIARSQGLIEYELI